MKNLSFLSAIAAFGILATGCSDDMGGKDPQIPEGEKSVARLTISAAALPQTRAAAENTDEATAEEMSIAVASGLKVFIFEQGDSGLFIDSEKLTLEPGTDGDGDGLPDNYTSAPFEVATGDVQIFVFANDKYNLINDPAPSETAAAFKKQAFTAFSTVPALAIAEDNNFLMGTLWGGVEETIVPGNTTAAPQLIDGITIGRLAAKVQLLIDNPGNPAETNPLWNTTLEGVFSDAKVRLGSLAKIVNPVGVITTAGRTDPYTAGTVVESAVHSETPPLDAVAYGVSTKFMQYYPATFGANDAVLYATENTSAMYDLPTDSDNVPHQYYGSTTYMQIEAIFTPDEVYDPANMAAAPVAGTPGMDFWAAEYQGFLTYFSGNPSSVADAYSVPVEYIGGKMYYKFPVFDTDESTDSNVTRNRVLRNHSYTFTVNVVRELGSDTDVVDPQEPITELTAIEVEVEVLNWDKVTTGEVDL